MKAWVLEKQAKIETKSLLLQELPATVDYLFDVLGITALYVVALFFGASIFNFIS